MGRRTFCWRFRWLLSLFSLVRRSLLGILMAGWGDGSISQSSLNLYFTCLPSSFVLRSRYACESWRTLSYSFVLAF
jgi:hypothetical protein